MLFKFLRYNLVQIAAYGIELSTFFAVLWVFPVYLVLSNVVAKASAGCFAFFLHKYFTFKKFSNYEVGNQAGRYSLILVGNMFLGSLLLLLFVDVMPGWGGKLLSDVMSVGVTFLLTHYFVFGASGNDKELMK
jgi:putative flippase GtrA